MDPLHATIEEFAVDGYTHIECCRPRCRVISPAADELASKDFDGANYRAALGKIALRGMRRPTALSQAMASG